MLATAKPRTDLQPPLGSSVSAVSPDDAPNLAELMLDAYLNTIDYHGEGIAEAMAEVEAYFSRAAKDPGVSQYSLVLTIGSTPACACLLEFWQRRSVPFVGFVMCRSTYKRRGLATYALHQAINRLKSAGYSEIRTIVTEGNTPSEALFARVGFLRVGQ